MNGTGLCGTVRTSWDPADVRNLDCLWQIETGVDVFSDLEWGPAYPTERRPS